MDRATGENNTTGESRAADAITIAWMLTALATLAAQCGAWIGQAIVAWAEAARDWPPQFLMLPGLMQFSALVTGLICLALTVVVHRVRATPPPQAIVRFAVAVGLLPLVAAVVRAFAPTP